jgi:DNA replication protein DnaC
MEISSVIKYYLNQYEKKCNFYKGENLCDRKELGCLCKKMAEISSLIYTIIPKEYHNFNIHKLSGFVLTKNGKDKVWSDADFVNIITTLSDYMYGRDSIGDFFTRDELNKISVLDKRYANGSNLVIHGNPFRNTKAGITRNVPTGKTLLACVILIDAIWRRMYAANKANTYSLSSYQTLKQDIKQKTDRAQDLKECDWLVIDDIVLPNNELDFNHQSFVSMFDDFLMTRMENHLPTIMLCEFDVQSRDYTDVMGYSFQKLVNSSNTWLIKIGG